MGPLPTLNIFSKKTPTAKSYYEKYPAPVFWGTVILLVFLSLATLFMLVSSIRNYWFSRSARMRDVEANKIRRQ